MGLRINQNSAAMNAHRNLAANDTQMGKAIERLSSGYKINRGSDDPAGLVISEGLRAQMGGLGQAISNAQDAVNMVKTAEGALTEVHSLLRSMRDLTVHAANSGANSSEAIAADQAQIKSAIESLNKIAERTSFGTRKLLDGSGAGVSFSNLSSAVSSVETAATGSQLKAGSLSINVSATATKASAAGATTFTTTAAAAPATQSTSRTFSGTNATAPAMQSTSASFNDATAVVNSSGTAKSLSINGEAVAVANNATVSDVVTAINAKTGDTGVTAAYNATSKHIELSNAATGSAARIQLTDTDSLLNGGAGINVTGANAVAAADAQVGTGGTISINGESITVQANDKASDVVAAINAKTGDTGVTASFDTTTNKVKLANATTGSAAAINYSESASILNGGAAINVTGANASGGSATTVANAGNITLNGATIAVGAADTVADVVTAINARTSETGVTATFNTTTNKVDFAQADYGSDKKIEYSESAAILNGGAAMNRAGTDAVATVISNGASSTYSAGKGNVLQNAAGDKITLAANTATGNIANAGTGAGTPGGLTFQVGAYDNQTASISIKSTQSDKLGTGVSGAAFSSVANIDVTVNAQDAIKVLDAAISQVSKQRADMGAFQKNVLESTINSLGVAKENVAASESTIRDADMAQEMVQFTRFQILNQAGTSMLTQANQAPQQLLSLLR